MRTDLTAPIRSIFGDVLKDGDTPVLMRTVICNALLAAPPPGQNMTESGEEKATLYKIALKTVDADIVEFTDEERVLIKKKVDTLYPPLIVGRVREILAMDVPAEVTEEAPGEGA